MRVAALTVLTVLGYVGAGCGPSAVGSDPISAKQDFSEKSYGEKVQLLKAAPIPPVEQQKRIAALKSGP